MFEQARHPRVLDDFDPDRVVEVKFDNFVAQRVLCLNGQWVSRGNVITYLANVGSGAHSGALKKPTDPIVRQIRSVVSYGLDGDMPNMTFNVGAINAGVDVPFKYAPTEVDPALFELVSAMHYLLLSPDVVRLEHVVRTELGQ